MNKLRTLLGVLILAAGSVGVYYLFQNKPVTEEEAEPEVAAEVAVQVGNIQRSTLHGYVQAYGQVDLDPGSGTTSPAAVTITAPETGIITEACCVQGQRVNKADILFTMDSRVAEAAVEMAKKALEFAEREFERQEKLREVQGTSEKLFLEAKQQLDAARSELTTAQIRQSLLKVTAPFSGMIVRVDARVGQTVTAAQRLAELHDSERLVVTAKVPNREISLLKLGQQVDIDTGIQADDGATKTAIVRSSLNFIDSQADDKTGTVEVRAPVPPDSHLRPGQFVKVRIIHEEHQNCLTVPEEGVVTTLDGDTVIAIVQGDTAYQRSVTPGLHEGGLVEIQGEGLKEGMAVVTVGTYGLPDKTKIRIIGQK
jgi:membrane fusion protein (multidrug efflux system)